MFDRKMTMLVTVKDRQNKTESDRKSDRAAPLDAYSFSRRSEQPFDSSQHRSLLLGIVRR